MKLINNFIINNKNLSILNLITLSLVLTSNIINYSTKKNFGINKKDHDLLFWEYFAGILDGDGYFYVKKKLESLKLELKYIKILLHNRDIRILTYIQNKLPPGPPLRGTWGITYG